GERLPLGDQVTHLSAELRRVAQGRLADFGNLGARFLGRLGATRLVGAVPARAMLAVEGRERLLGFAGGADFCGKVGHVASPWCSISCLIRCTVPVPRPVSLATFKIPVPAISMSRADWAARAFSGRRTCASSTLGRPSLLRTMPDLRAVNMPLSASSAFTRSSPASARRRIVFRSN